MIFERRKRHIDRYVEIGQILARHEWEHVISRLGLSRRFQVRGWSRGKTPGPVQVRESLEELGPTFIKLGQVLSTRGDVLPLDYIKELESLQDDAPRVPFIEIKRVIEEELAGSLDELFMSFEEEPLAAASLGQTHRAKLLDGTEVVVKIQRPGVHQIIKTDLEVLTGIAKFLEKHSEKLKIYGLTDLVEEFSITIMQELDYTREGRNADVLKDNLVEMDYVHVAETIWTSSASCVLTAEYVDGVKISDLAEISKRGYSAHEIARNLWRTYLKMIFVDGFYHADPHPGNLVVLENNVIGLLDYGMVGNLDKDMRASVTILLSRYVDQDSLGVANAVLAMGTAPPDLDRKQFRFEISRVLKQYYGAPLREIKMGEALSKLLTVGAKFRITLPASIGMLVKVIIGIEGIVRILDPDYDMASEAKPFIKKAVQGEFTFSTLSGELLQNIVDWKKLLAQLPDQASQVLDHMAEGSFRIVFKHEGLELPTRDLDKSANRLSLAVISAATIIASALALSSKVGPSWMGYPVIGMVGFAIAFLFGIWLMISILRSGRL
ncbi:MAG: ABC1 kinase family protein [Armatimonadota bacterium]